MNCSNYFVQFRYLIISLNGNEILSDIMLLRIATYYTGLFFLDGNGKQHSMALVQLSHVAYNKAATSTTFRNVFSKGSFPP